MAKFQVRWLATVEVPEGLMSNNPKGPAEPENLVRIAMGAATSVLKNALNERSKPKSGLRLLDLSGPAILPIA